MEEEKKVPSLYDKLNMAPPTVVLEKMPAVMEPAVPDAERIDADFEDVRQNLETAASIGQKALDDVADIATQSQDAEHYSVVASMLKSVVEVNKERMDIYRRKQLAKKDHAPQSQGNTNVLNVTLTTADLMKMIKGTQT